MLCSIKFGKISVLNFFLHCVNFSIAIGVWLKVQILGKAVMFLLNILIDFAATWLIFFLKKKFSSIKSLYLEMKMGAITMNGVVLEDSVNFFLWFAVVLGFTVGCARELACWKQSIWTQLCLHPPFLPSLVCVETLRIVHRLCVRSDR